MHGPGDVMTRCPGRFPLGTGPSPTVYGRRMKTPFPIRFSFAPMLGVLVWPARVFPLLLASLFSTTPLLHGQDGQAYRVLYAASERYYSLETLCAHFEQQVELTLLRYTVVSEGTVCQRQPDRFSMRFSDPDGDLVVVDGEFLWTFYPSQDDRQVMRFSAAGGAGGFNLYQTFLEDPRGRFEAVHEGREPMGDGLSHKIVLTPRETDDLRPPDFRSAVVWFDVERYLITAVDIHDTNESIRRLRFSDIRVDIEIPDQVFRFVPPEGARVLATPEGLGVVRK